LNYVGLLYARNNCLKDCTIQPFLVAVLDFAILFVAVMAMPFVAV